MPLLLPTILLAPRSNQHFVLVQSSAAQSGIPILQKFLPDARTKQRGHHQILFFCFLYPPEQLIHQDERHDQQSTHQMDIFDRTMHIPDYFDDWTDPCSEIVAAVRNVPSNLSLDVVIDSIDCLASDLNSNLKAYQLISDLLELVRARSAPSRVIVHVFTDNSSYTLLPLLLSTRLSPSLTHLVAHPCAFFTHLAKEYLTVAPPRSGESAPKFWGVYLPIRDRLGHAEELVHGESGEGIFSGAEFVVEVLVRGSGKRGVERVLEGWREGGEPCELEQLNSFRGMWGGSSNSPEAAPDPTQNVSFNLNLTTAQMQSRAQVPLPYTHEAQPSSKPPTPSAGAILYDPDSADDIDDDDPDEDLDI